MGRERQFKYSMINGNSVRIKHYWNTEEASSQLRIKLKLKGLSEWKKRVWFIIISISMVGNAKPQLAWLIPTINHAGSNPSDFSIDWILFYIYGHHIDMSCVWLLSTWHVPVLYLVSQSCPTLCNPMDCSPPGSSVHGESPGKNTGMGCHALLQGIFPTQGSNPGLLNCRWTCAYCHINFN